MWAILLAVVVGGLVTSLPPMVWLPNGLKLVLGVGVGLLFAEKSYGVIGELLRRRKTRNATSSEPDEPER